VRTLFVLVRVGAEHAVGRTELLRSPATCDFLAVGGRHLVVPTRIGEDAALGLRVLQDLVPLPGTNRARRGHEHGLPDPGSRHSAALSGDADDAGLHLVGGRPSESAGDAVVPGASCCRFQVLGIGLLRVLLAARGDHGVLVVHQGRRQGLVTVDGVAQGLLGVDIGAAAQAGSDGDRRKPEKGCADLGHGNSLAVQLIWIERPVSSYQRL
jgi:hypothetical protein